MKPNPIKIEDIELCAVNDNTCDYFKINDEEDLCYCGECSLLKEKLYYKESFSGAIVIKKPNKCK